MLKASTSTGSSFEGGSGGADKSAPPQRNDRVVIDFVCKTKYSNTLPDLPFEPKFLRSPFPMLKRFIEYKPTSLEKNYKYELLAEPDIGVRIDLIDPMTYWVDTEPDKKPPLHPTEALLLEDETVSQLNTKRSIQHRKIVPWMRKTEYISDVTNRYGMSGMERQESKIGVALKKKYGDEFLYKDRDSQIAAIEKTFEDAKKPVRRHFGKRNVTAVEELPIFPDFETWKYPFAQVLFDADPLPLVKTYRKEKLENALLRGMRDADGVNFVGYFTPNDETVQRRSLDLTEAQQDENALSKLETFTDDYNYEHTLEREYTWEITKKGSDQVSFFLSFRNGSVFYNELDTIKLYRRLKSTASTRNTILIVRHRFPDSKEIKEQAARVHTLLNPYEQIEDEEEVVEQQDAAEKRNEIKSEKSSDAEHSDNDENGGKGEKQEASSAALNESESEKSSDSEHSDNDENGGKGEKQEASGAALNESESEKSSDSEHSDNDENGGKGAQQEASGGVLNESESEKSSDAKHSDNDENEGKGEQKESSGGVSNESESEKSSDAEDSDNDENGGKGGQQESSGGDGASSSDGEHAADRGDAQEESDDKSSDDEEEDLSQQPLPQQANNSSSASSSDGGEDSGDD